MRLLTGPAQPVVRRTAWASKFLLQPAASHGDLPTPPYPAPPPPGSQGPFRQSGLRQGQLCPRQLRHGRLALGHLALLPGPGPRCPSSCSLCLVSLSVSSRATPCLPSRRGHCPHHTDSDLEPTTAQSHILELRSCNLPNSQSPWWQTRGREAPGSLCSLRGTARLHGQCDRTTSEEAWPIGCSECGSWTEEVRVPTEGRPPPTALALTSLRGRNPARTP